ncbi:hypothetical protein COURTHOUSE_101 [Mycobacterium phage Courthouse]|uniref:Uncharacterized protein n=2 Tax=Omegavirus courthouse TaxID=1089119 RepID=G8I5F8_9CAUD|nr:hypothetical protein CM09_gp101 [Mycobacterium phage Courthouse]YP_009205236.1 hypothetical protein AVT17_gp106 [Mycobacterium phage Ariel]ASZ74180.1 hypothetical protein SEA_SQUINT_104 [Mycobacterium phage Squint]ATS92945.1 hypothetical protein SEA_SUPERPHIKIMAN_103 [Mycobacterium phage Superphikiman]AER47952.1 hypothetical protein COURTHOUSE_101 [Mycobacterium phage Courthouse]AIM49983.1 hypothetical protein PBI_ARIEL_106 [Mycobacterium phage Ariel]
MTIDLDRITHPLRLAKGSHQPGSGKGCAMNVISYINGDTVITDYPKCSARPLARLVQQCNDELADSDGFLTPENSVLVLDLGWQTVGTADVPESVMLRWLRDILVDPVHGVVRHARPDGVAAISRVAELCARQASGVEVSGAEWRSAQVAANAAYAAANATNAANAAYAAANAAYAAGVAAANAAYAAGVAAADAADARVEFTRWAIARWRALAGLDTPRDIVTQEVDDALARINAGMPK